MMAGMEAPIHRHSMGEVFPDASTMKPLKTAYTTEMRKYGSPKMGSLPFDTPVVIR